MAFNVQDLLTRLQDVPEDVRAGVLNAVSRVKSVGDLGDVLKEHGINLDSSQLSDLFTNLKNGAGDVLQNVTSKAGALVDKDGNGKPDLLEKASALFDKDGNGKPDLVESAGDFIGGIFGKKDAASEAAEEAAEGSTGASADGAADAAKIVASVEGAEAEKTVDDTEDATNA